MALGASDSRYEFVLAAQDAFTKEINKLKSELKKLSGDFQKYGSEAEKASKAAGSGLRSLAKAAAAGFATHQLVQFSDEITSIKNKLRTVAKESEIPQLTEQMIDMANRARVGVTGATTLFTRLHRAISQAGGTLQQSAVITETVAKGLSLSGAAAGEAEAAMLQLSQAFNKGKLDGDEFRTVMELMPDAMQAIADQLGVAKGKLIELAPEGKITADIMANAFITAADSINQRFSQSMPTIGQALTVLKNQVLRLWGELNDEIPVTSGIAKLILTIGKAVEAVGRLVITGVRGLKELAGVMDDLKDAAGAALGFIQKHFLLLTEAVLTFVIFTKRAAIAAMFTGIASSVVRSVAVMSLAFRKTLAEAIITAALAIRTFSVTAVIGQLVPACVAAVRALGSITKSILFLAGKFTLIAAVVTTVATLIVSNWEWISDRLEPIFKFIAKAGQKAPEILAKVWNAFINGLGKSIIWVIDKIIEVAELANNIPGITIDTDGLYNARKKIADFAETMNVTTEDVEGAFAAIGKGAKKAAGLVMGSFPSVGDAIDLTVPSLTGFSGAMEDAGAAAGKAKKAVEEASPDFVKLAADINNLNKDYDSLALEAGKALQQMTNDHNTKIAEMDASIAKLKKSLADVRADLKKGLGELGEDWDKDKAGFNMSKAEAAVEQEQKIAEMQAEYDEKRKEGLEEIAKLEKEGRTKEMNEKRIANGKELDELQAKIDKEKAALDAFNKNQVFNNGELETARQNASLTGFERSINGINEQLNEAASNYETRRQELMTDADERTRQAELELSELEAKKLKEEEVFAASRDQYTKTEAVFIRFKDRFLEGLTAMSRGAEGKLVALQNRFESLRNLIAEVGQFDPDDQGYSFAGVQSAAATRGSTTNNTTNAAVNLNISINGADDPRTTAEKVEEAVSRALQKARLASQ